MLPLRVKVPLPLLLRLPLPLMAPLKVVLRLLPPVDSVLLPSCTVPAPDSAPMVSFVDSEKVAPESTLTLALSEMAAPPLAVRPPADTWTPPVKVLVPDSVSVPLPVLVRPPVPLIPPANVVLLSLPPVVRVLLPSVRVLPLVPASEPMVSLDASSSVEELLTVTAELSWMAEPPLRISLPEATVTLPSWVLLPASVMLVPTAPPVNSVPEPDITPDSTKSPALE
ncbi:hypothetical protein D9M68_247800 [compost metagenome]